MLHLIKISNLIIEVSCGFSSATNQLKLMIDDCDLSELCMTTLLEQDAAPNAYPTGLSVSLPHLIYYSAFGPPRTSPSHSLPLYLIILDDCAHVLRWI